MTPKLGALSAFLLLPSLSALAGERTPIIGEAAATIHTALLVLGVPLSQELQRYAVKDLTCHQAGTSPFFSYPCEFTEADSGIRRRILSAPYLHQALYESHAPKDDENTIHIDELECHSIIKVIGYYGVETQHTCTFKK